MSNEGRVWSGLVVLVAALILTAAAQAAVPFTLTSWDAAAVARAQAGAVRRLKGERCRRLLTDLTDEQGRRLQQNLDEGAASPADYVARIAFLDGSSQSLCRQARTALASRPGMPRIYICRAFADFQLKQPALAENLLIHEILHTLGLGENPPSSLEITQRVQAQCW